MTDQQHQELEGDFYNQAPCGYFTTNQQGIILKVNDTLLKWVEYTRSELLGKTWDILLTIGGKLYLETHYRPLLAMQGFVKELNFDLLAKNGKRIPVLLNTQTYVYQPTQEILYNTTVFDITQRKQYEKELLLERKKAEELLEKLKKAYGDLEKFAMVVSHDLRSPLANISMLSEIILENYRDKFDEEGVNYLLFLNDSAKKLIDFVSRLLTFYKMTHIQTQQATEFNLSDLLESLVKLLNPYNEHEISYPSEEVTIFTNQTALEQILLNLLTNAIKYNDKKRVIIQINFWQDDHFYHFSVKDNGKGIPQEKLKNIFELFQTLGHKDREGNEGHGIGLSVVKRLVESLQGNIHIRSEVGKGTTFYFTVAKR